MGSLHAAVLDDLPWAEVIAWCDTDPNVVGRAPTGIPVMSDLSDLMDMPHLEAVVVATPPETHRSIAEAALQRGLWVLCEKPIAARLDDAERLVELADLTGRLVVGHTLRFDPNYRTVVEGVKAGEVGDVVTISVRRAVPDYEGNQLAHRTTLPVEVLVHDIDLIQWIAGNVRRVFGFNASTGPDNCVTAFVGTMELESGAIALTEANWMTASRTGLESDYRLAVFGTSGVAYAEFRNPPVGVFGPQGEMFRRTEWLANVAGAQVGVIRTEVEHFLRTVRGQSSAWPCTAQDAFSALAVALAFDVSAKSGYSITPNQIASERKRKS